MDAISICLAAVINIKGVSTMWQIPLFNLHNYTDLLTFYPAVYFARQQGSSLEIEIFHILRVFLNEIATWFNIITHERIKDRIRQNSILNANL